MDLQALQVQNLFWAPAWACAITFVLNIGITYGMAHSFGFEGAAAANSVARLLLFLIMAGVEIKPRSRPGIRICVVYKSSWTL